MTRVELIRPDFCGAVLDGRADDTAALSTLLAAASTSGLDVPLPRNAIARVTEPLYGWGGLRLSGGTIRWDVDVGRYAFSLGITRSGAEEPQPARPWHGKLSGVTLQTSPAARAGGHLLQLHAALGGWLMRDVTIDLTESQNASINALSSARDWCSVPVCADGTIERLRVEAAPPSRGGNGGINLMQPRDVTIRDAVVTSGDDPLALFDGIACSLSGCRIYSTHGRFLLAGGTGHTAADVRHTRIRGSDGAWSDEGTEGLISLAHQGARSQTSYGHHLEACRAYLPNGPTGFCGMLNVSGARHCTTRDLHLQSDCYSASAVEVYAGIWKWPGWKDPTNWDQDGVARSRYCDIDAKCYGERPPVVVEKGFLASDLGPMTYRIRGSAGRALIGSQSVWL